MRMKKRRERSLKAKGENESERSRRRRRRRRRLSPPTPLPSSREREKKTHFSRLVAAAASSPSTSTSKAGHIVGRCSKETRRRGKRVMLRVSLSLSPSSPSTLAMRCDEIERGGTELKKKASADSRHPVKKTKVADGKEKKKSQLRISNCAVCTASKICIRIFFFGPNSKL